MPKKRVSLTLSENLVDEIDHEAEREDLNRSELVEDILKEYLESMTIDSAVVFCGSPEVKALNEWRGEPVLKHVLRDLSEYVDEVYLLTGQNRMEIKEVFRSSYRDMELNYYSDEVSGTGSALEKLSEEIEGTFLAVNGHVVSDVDIKEMMEVHRDEERIAMMALTTVENPSVYGVALLKGNKILGFEEKPEPGEEPSRLINAGTYIFEPEIFNHLDEEDIESVFENLSDKAELTGYIYGGEWKDFKK
jgi:NDP-sugar pyrophosphorylase family protein